MADYPAKRGVKPDPAVSIHEHVHLHEAPPQPPLIFNKQQRLKVETRDEQWELEGLGLFVGLPAFIIGSFLALGFGLWFSGIFFHTAPDGTGGGGAGWFFTFLISMGLAWIPCVAIVAFLWVAFWGLILSPFWVPALGWLYLFKKIRSLVRSSQSPA